MAVQGLAHLFPLRCYCHTRAQGSVPQFPCPATSPGSRLPGCKGDIVPTRYPSGRLGDSPLRPKGRPGARLSAHTARAQREGSPGSKALPASQMDGRWVPVPMWQGCLGIHTMNSTQGRLLSYRCERSALGVRLGRRHGCCLSHVGLTGRCTYGTRSPATWGSTTLPTPRLLPELKSPRRPDRLCLRRSPVFYH